MGDFKLGDLFANVSDSDTRERLEYLPLEQLREDSRNFYNLGGLDDLADNIQFAGLQQPIRVRETDDGFVIVSGHRRTAAIRKLAEQEPERWATVPCIVETCRDSEAMQELKLILANRDIRTMTSADIAAQAARVQELFVQLKAEGVEFKGRMRDAVAEACNISASKLARLNAIRKNLKDEELAELYRSGDLPEETAYQLSRLSEFGQKTVREKGMDKDGKFLTYSGTVEKIAQAVANIKCPAECPEGGSCVAFPYSARVEAVTAKLLRSQWRTPQSCISGCCLKCSDLPSCAHPCRFGEAESKKTKEQKKEESSRQKAEADKRRAVENEKRLAVWRRFLSLFDRSGLTLDEFREKVDEVGLPNEENVAAARNGDAEALTFKMPFGYGISLSTVGTIRKIAAVLGCTVGELLGEEEPEEEPVLLPASHCQECSNEDCICNTCRRDQPGCCFDNRDLPCPIKKGECPDYLPE